MVEGNVGTQNAKMELAKLRSKLPSWKPSHNTQGGEQGQQSCIGKHEGGIQDFYADFLCMDTLAKAWYMIYHEHIGNEVVAAQAVDSATPTPTPTSRKMFFRIGW
jgi:hypothetical protein